MTNRIKRYTMKKTYMMILVAGLVCLAACQKEDLSIDELKNNAITYIRANEESSAATKASIDNTTAAFTWNTNDQIAVYTTDGYKISDGLADTYNNTNAATFAFSGDNAVTEANRTDFAIFPASLVWDGTAIRISSASNHTSTNLTLTLPASYTLAEVQDNVSPCPMIAANAPDGDLSFKHLCALLRITVQNIPKDTKRIEFDFNGKKVQGEFTLSSVAPGTTSITTSATDGTDDIITVTMADNTTWHDALVVNLPVPAGVASTGEYTNVTVSAYNAISGGIRILYLTRPVKKTENWVPTRLTSRKITATLPVFSVSSTKKVVIAPSNLQATTSDGGVNWTWHFAANPWDYIGVAYSNRKISGDGTVSENGSVDLFGWVGASNSTWGGALGTTENAAMYGITNSKTLNSTDTYGNVSDETLKSDWGNTINDGYTWRTLSMAEWTYMLKSRASGSTVNGAFIYTTAGGTTSNVTNARYTLATINSIHGLIIFPNGVTFESSEATWRYINDRIPSSFGETKWSNGTQCTTEQWTALAAKGCVFLPAAGHRNGQDVYYYNGEDNCGHYWTSTPNGTNQALFMRFVKSEGAVNDSFNHERWYGHSVRLVRDL